MRGVLTAEKEYTEKRISLYVKNPEHISGLLDSIDRVNEELEENHSDVRLKVKYFHSPSNLTHEIPWQAVIGELSEDLIDLVTTHRSHLGYTCAFTPEPLTNRELKQVRKDGISDVYSLNEGSYDDIVRGVLGHITQSQPQSFLSRVKRYLQPRR